MWTRTENQAKHILLNRTRDGMRVQVNVFLMKENDWRLSLGGHSSFYTPNVFKLKMTVCCLTSQSSFPIQCSQCLKQQWFTFKVTLEVTVSSEAGLCVGWKWLLLPWSLDKFCYKLEAVCMHSALMAGWSAGWWGGDSSEQQQSPQALLFCLTLSRTQHGVPTGQDFVQEAVCVCVAARSLL